MASLLRKRSAPLQLLSVAAFLLLACASSTQAQEPPPPEETSVETSQDAGAIPPPPPPSPDFGSIASPPPDAVLPIPPSPAAAPSPPTSSGCPAGYYANSTTGSFCYTCPRSTYAAAGATSCTPCPAGTASVGRGATSVGNCTVAFRTTTANLRETFTTRTSASAATVTTGPRTITVTSGQPVIPPAAANSNLNDYVLYALNNGSWLAELTQSVIGANNTNNRTLWFTYLLPAGPINAQLIYPAQGLTGGFNNTLALQDTSIPGSGAGPLNSWPVLLAGLLAFASVAMAHMLPMVV